MTKEILQIQEFCKNVQRQMQIAICIQKKQGYNIRGMKIYRWEVPKKCTNTHENTHEKGKTRCVDCWGRYACLII